MAVALRAPIGSGSCAKPWHSLRELFAGLPEHGWRAHYYTRVDELGDPAKALVRWLSGD